jgi:hypothetical protein
MDPEVVDSRWDDAEQPAVWLATVFGPLVFLP